MSNVTHIYFGNAYEHPIITSYLNFNPEHKVIHCLENKKKIKRVASLFNQIFKSKNSPQWYQCHDPISLIVVFILKGRKKTIYDSHEIFSSYVKNKYISKLFFKLEKTLCRLAVKCIFPNQQRRDVYFDAMSRENVFVVENLLNDMVLNFEKVSDDFISVYNLAESNYIELLYVGTFTEVRAVKEIIEAVSLVNDKEMKVRLHFVGEPTELLQNFSSGRSDILLHGRVSRESLIKSYQVFDASFAFYKPINLNNKLCAPTKMFENECYLLPTICNHSEYVSQLIEEKRLQNCYLSTDISPVSIANQIRLVRKRKKNILMASLCLNRAIKLRLLWSTQQEIIESLYLDVN